MGPFEKKIQYGRHFQDGRHLVRNFLRVIVETMCFVFRPRIERNSIKNYAMDDVKSVVGSRSGVSQRKRK